LAATFSFDRRFPNALTFLMSRTKRRPHRNLAASRPIGRRDFRCQLHEQLLTLNTNVRFGYEAAAALQSATQDYLHDLSCEAHRSAGCAQRASVTRHDWLLAARMCRLRRE
jgi:histone H3/H4